MKTNRSLRPAFPLLGLCASLLAHSMLPAALMECAAVIDFEAFPLNSRVSLHNPYQNAATINAYSTFDGWMRVGDANDPVHDYHEGRIVGSSANHLIHVDPVFAWYGGYGEWNVEINVAFLTPRRWFSADVYSDDHTSLVYSGSGLGGAFSGSVPIPGGCWVTVNVAAPLGGQLERFSMANHVGFS